MEDRVESEIKKYFRPEFINRLDDIIVFHSLSEEQITSIVEIQLKGLEKRLSAQHLQLQLDDAAKKLLAAQGYDPQFGARPLKRAIQTHLLDPLSMRLLDGKFKPGDVVRVTASDGELQFES